MLRKFKKLKKSKKLKKFKKPKFKIIFKYFLHSLSTLLAIIGDAKVELLSHQSNGDRLVLVWKNLVFINPFSHNTQISFSAKNGPLREISGLR
jgi:hypothetical protein